MSDAIVRAASEGVANWPRPDRSSLPFRDSNSEFKASAKLMSSSTPLPTVVKANRITFLGDSPPSIEPLYDTNRDHPKSQTPQPHAHNTQPRLENGD